MYTVCRVCPAPHRGNRFNSYNFPSFFNFNERAISFRMGNFHLENSFIWLKIDGITPCTRCVHKHIFFRFVHVPRIWIVIAIIIMTMFCNEMIRRECNRTNGLKSLTSVSLKHCVTMTIFLYSLEHICQQLLFRFRMMKRHWTDRRTYFHPEFSTLTFSWGWSVECTIPSLTHYDNNEPIRN